MKLWSVIVIPPKPKDKRRTWWKAVHTIQADSAEDAIKYLRDNTGYLEVSEKQGAKITAKEFTQRHVNFDMFRL